VASIKRHKDGWRAVIHSRRAGVYTSKVCRTKAIAESWAVGVEDSIAKGTYHDASCDILFKDIVTRYIDAVSVGKKGYASEKSRLNALARRDIGKKKMSLITAADFVKYRDMRLKQVKPDTVIRELNLISSIYNHARREWNMHIDNPASSECVKRPPTGKGRTRRLNDGEYQLLIDSLTAARNKKVLPFFLLAIETACRRSEMLSLRWVDIDLNNQVADLRDSKNNQARSVPLSLTAIEILKAIDSSGDMVFDLTPDAIKGVWKRACKRVGITGLRVHDLRHEATSRLFEKGLDSMIVAQVTGHRDMRMLQRYTQVKASKVAKLLG